MQVLLIDLDEQQAKRWKDRLEYLDATVRIAGHQETLDSTDRFAVAIVKWPAPVERPKDWIQKHRSKCGTIIGLLGTDLDAASAYEFGLDDCLVEACSDSELLIKLTRGDQLEMTRQRLAQAQKLESIGELAAGIAHEINTPIQYVGDNTRFVDSAFEDLVSVLELCKSLIGATGLSEINSITNQLKQALNDADIEYLLDEIPSAIGQTLEGVDRVANIVRAMKEFAHPGVSVMAQVDLAKSIENTVMVARNEWKYVAKVVTDFDPTLPPVPCLPGELNQVILNLIINAAHAIGDFLGESPQQKGTIKISTCNASSFAEIRIGDSGCGIAKEDIERIFTPFFTTKPVGKGTGQGLAIAHSVIVEKHGGTIEVESEVGTGTTFVIRIPLEHRNDQSTEDPSGEGLVATTPS